MKIVIAPDSFKESLSATAAARAIARGVLLAAPHAECRIRPMADGGEGTVKAMAQGIAGAEIRHGRVRNALGHPVRAHWGWLGPGKAVVEVAAAAGLADIPAGQRDPLRASTYGVGQQIRAALDAGASHIILGLGGSATNDAGAGLLQALGARLLDTRGAALEPGGAALAQLHTLDTSGLDARLADTRFLIASDVDHPLCGRRGASAVFGPQKGAPPAQVRQLDAALAHFADVCAAVLGRDCREQPGAGAAGGVGFTALAFLRGTLRPGVEVVAEACGLANALEDADLAFTGEGRLDAQTLHGKTPAGVARLAQAAGVPLIALAGALDEGYQNLYAAGLTAAFSITAGPTDLDSALRQADALLTARARDVMRLWLSARPGACGATPGQASDQSEAPAPSS